MTDETTSTSADAPRWRWRLALAGLGLAVAALVALSGPGRIDIVDGQTRYEVARSLRDHGDLEIRDPRVTWAVFPGRDGRRFTTYRLPQSLLGVPALVASDLFGGVDENRRRFAFSLLGAALAGGIAMLYAAAFRDGAPAREALVWGALGVFATPSWFYATSTFDDFLGAVVVVALFVVARRRSPGRGRGRAVALGLLGGCAFQVKPPLVLFLLPALALAFPLRRSERRPLVAWGLAGAATAALVAAHGILQRWHFPPETAAARAALERAYVPIWWGDPLAALLGWLASPGASVLAYCPPVLLAAAGLWRRGRDERSFGWAFAAALALFVAFLAKLTFWKGDPAWGPRYLTPVFALGWLFVARPRSGWRRFAAGALVAAGVVVQLLALAIDPHRLFVAQDLHATFYAEDQWVYFEPEVSNLVARPGEIAAAWRERARLAPEFTPAPAPTFAFPMLNDLERGPATVERYAVLATFRPWWWAMRDLPEPERPVPLAPTAGALLALAALGVVVSRLALGRGAPR